MNIGNALEVVEVLELLRGGGPEDLKELCVHTAGWMLHLGGVSKSVAEGKQHSEQLLSSGKALEKFRQMVQLQGGDARVIDDPKRLPQPRGSLQVVSAKKGFIASMQCEQIGTASVILGGGRERKEDSVDPAVGIVLHKKVGDAVAAGEPLASIYYNSDERLDRARQMIAAACVIADEAPPTKRPLIHRVIQKSGERR
jgi:thymidine phosphorylase